LVHYASLVDSFFFGKGPHDSPHHHHNKPSRHMIIITHFEKGVLVFYGLVDTIVGIDVGFIMDAFNFDFWKVLFHALVLRYRLSRWNGFCPLSRRSEYCDWTDRDDDGDGDSLGSLVAEITDPLSDSLSTAFLLLLKRFLKKAIFDIVFCLF
jgi:hypothetical protein